MGSNLKEKNICHSLNNIGESETLPQLVIPLKMDSA
jgi:hypothetical protein